MWKYNLIFIKPAATTWNRAYGTFSRRYTNKDRVHEDCYKDPRQGLFPVVKQGNTQRINYPQRMCANI